MEKLHKEAYSTVSVMRNNKFSESDAPSFFASYTCVFQNMWNVEKQKSQTNIM